ncbi:hypothetical protein BGZ68_001258 [Mortierella alpina]|nr:hypothetical protein BGZ68_001258 [Mortierella alpina]
MSPLRRRYRAVLVLAAIIASTTLIALVSAQADCGKNEFYNDCGSSCPVTCENINSAPAFCTLNCVPGCFCTPGLVRRKDGQCVQESQCKTSVPAPAPTTASGPAPSKPSSTPVKKSKKCKVNEVYRERKSTCERSCKDPKSCSRNRKAGCFCKDGLLRSKEGLCVRKQSCKKTNSSQSKTKADRKKADRKKPEHLKL